MISFEQKKMPVGNRSQAFIYTFGGKRGIRTPGASQLNGFQDRRNRPLCHLSKRQKYNLFSTYANLPTHIAGYCISLVFLFLL